MIIRSHGCHTDFHSFFRIQYPPFFGIKKWITSFPTIRRNVNKITGHLHLVCLDDHGSLFKGYDYYYAKKRGCPTLQSSPILFSLYSLLLSFRKKYHLEHSLLFSCPASASVRKNQKAFIRHVKKSNIKGIQFIFLVPQYNSYAEQMEKEADGDPAFRFFYGLPRHEVQAAIIESNAVFLYSIQEQQSHVVGGHVMRRSLDCSGCRRNLHPPGRHCSEETQYQKSAASLASNDPGKHQENSVAGGQAVLVSPLFSKSCLSAVGNTIQ